MAQITQLFLLIFKNIENWSKLTKFGPKTLILFAFSRHFFRASSSTESFVAAHTDAPNGLLFGRNVPLGIFTTTSNLDFGIFLEFI